MVKNTDTTVELTTELVNEIDRIAKTPGDLSEKDEKRLIEIYKLTGDARLGADVMYVKQYPSIKKICKSFAFKHHTEQDVNDYIQSSYEYMLEALDTYKFSANTRFNTHLSVILKKCLNDEWYKSNNTSKYYQQEYYKIGCFCTTFEKEYGRTPTDSEIMDSFGIKRNSFNAIMNAASTMKPLYFEEVKSNIEDDIFDSDLLMNEDSIYMNHSLLVSSPEELFCNTELSAALAEFIEEIGPVRAEILMRFAGIGYDKPQSKNEIARETGYSRAYVRKVLNQISQYGRRKLSVFAD